MGLHLSATSLPNSSVLALSYFSKKTQYKRIFVAHAMRTTVTAFMETSGKYFHYCLILCYIYKLFYVTSQVGIIKMYDEFWSYG